MPTQPQPCWHQAPLDELHHHLDAGPEGLDSTQVAERQAHYGPNTLTMHPSETPWQRWLRQFNNILIYILLFAAIISWLMGHWADGWVILAVILINSLFGWLQEGKAEQALASIRTLLKQQVDVLRDKQRQRLDAEQLVPGDIVLLAAGDKVPADIRLVDANALKVQESALTGESSSVDKSTGVLPETTPLAERHNMLFAGTLVTQGKARGLVVATGDATELGKIGQMLNTIESMDTPLLRELGKLGRQLSGWILLLTLLAFSFGWFFREYPVDQLLMIAISLAVAAIPEGLPAVITITMAIGVQRMARHNAIVRRLPAVETLGCVDVICTDKTGTLTTNNMTVTRLVTPTSHYEVTGSDYDPHGEIIDLQHHLPANSDEPHLHALLKAAVLCNDASFSQLDGKRQLQGDPTEGALWVVAEKYKLVPPALRQHHIRMDEIPFDSSQGWMMTRHALTAQHDMWLLKGAPERLLPQISLDNEQLQYWQAQLDMLASHGLRTLLLASMNVSHDEPTPPTVMANFNVLGLIAMQDPPRAEAITAISRCRQAGIKIVMITGDHIRTASAIAIQLGISQQPHALTGSELDVLSDEALFAQLDNIDIVARATPANKLRLIHAFQQRGHTLAMTGDGVNDAPALKQADIGVAMGRSGTETAKEASAIVLADDNFATLGEAVRQGRAIYENLRRTLVFLLPTNGAQALVLLIAMLWGAALPITAIQILWINMVSAITLALPLAFEKGDATLMLRPPRGRESPLLGVSSWLFILLAALLMALVSIAGFEWQESQGFALAQNRTFAINVLVGCEMAFLINCRCLNTHIFCTRAWRGNSTVLWAVGSLLLLQLAQSYLPWVNSLFGTAPLPASSWLVIVAISASYLLAIELMKKVARILSSNR